jgi:hypothetical protein
LERSADCFRIPPCIHDVSAFVVAAVDDVSAFVVAAVDDVLAFVVAAVDDVLAFVVAAVVVVSAFVVAAVVDNVSALLNLRASSAIAVVQALVMAVCYLCHRERLRV